MIRALVAAAWLLPAIALAQVPERFGYQGRLLKADGTPESASVSLKFQLFDAATGGASVWTETQSVQPVDGFYSAVLGKTTAFPANAFDGADRWLEISVNGTPLSPRQSVSSVPYAIRATNLSGGTVDATSIKVGGATVIDSSGKLAGSAVKLGAGSGLAFDTSSNLSLLKTCADGQVLKYLSGAWACAVDNSGSGGSTYTAGAGVAISGANAISVMACNANGQVLTWNGTTWTCALPPSGSAGITAVTGTAPVTATTSGSTVTLSMPQASATQDGYLSKADYAKFANAGGGGGGANLIAWARDATKWASLAGGGTATVDTSESQEGEGDFLLTYGTSGPVWTYGDYIPVDPTRIYAFEIAVQLKTGAGKFFAGYQAFDKNKVALTGNSSTSGVTYGTPLADNVLLVQNVWTRFATKVSGEGTNKWNFPAGTRFIKPLVMTNYGDIGSTKVASFFIREWQGGVEAYSATRTGGVAAGVTTMTPIPGLTQTFTLVRPALVQITANGEQRATVNSSTSCHVGLGYRVNTAIRGNGTYGSRIHMSNLASFWWSTWTLNGSELLQPGTYTIDVVARDTAAICNVCMESDASLPGYTGCDLNLLVVYK